MTIPRRLVLEPPTWLFNYDLSETVGLFKGLFSFIVAGPIIAVDTAIWVFIIMIAPGPFIFSGLVEVVLDYRVITYLHDGRPPERTGHSRAIGLNPKDRMELLTAVVAGNLETEGVRVNPQEELSDVLSSDDIERAAVHLRAMLACQITFGATVGAPILLYIGSFIYTLVDLHNSDGDPDTARALAFGMWWMCIVHVAAVSGCLLASNNPSTAASIVGKGSDKPTTDERKELAFRRDAIEDQVQAIVEAVSRLPLTYRARFEPVWMWTRGKSKARWLRQTNAWKQTWFRKRIEIGLFGWISIALVAFILIFIPCALAFWIEFLTPPAGIACRCLTILMYAVAQLTLTVLSAWSHIKGGWEKDDMTKHRMLGRLRTTWLGYTVVILVLFPAWLIALVTTFLGTLMQITGVFNNCLCSITTSHWVRPRNTIVKLTTYTQADQQTSDLWKNVGYAGLIFLACVTYLGWWSQRFLREKFIQRVKDLVRYSTFDSALHSLTSISIG
ncbi:hypothetical protein MMC19_006025 [Ptychographa xylographoides]|nr:hypothetical protein [Ptychographa xylographoides]